jgi:hypothetical protein
VQGCRTRSRRRLPPDALHPDRPLPAVDPAAPAVADPAKLGELDRHRAVWELTGLTAYRLTLLYGCQCALAGQPVEVRVTGGAVEAAWVAGQPIAPDDLVGFPATVDQLFAYVERNAGAGKVEVTYDEQRGFPLAIGVDPSLELRDDEVRIAVTPFAAGR